MTETATQDLTRIPQPCLQAPDGPKRKLVAGVIGCGSISRFHFEGFAKADVRVARLCDVSQEAAQPWVERTSAKWSSDWREVVDDPEIDVIAVLTSTSTHRAICEGAIAAGKAVICEKTLASTLDDSVAITETALKAKAIFFTNYMKRYLPTIVKAKALLPTLGQIISTHVRVHQYWGDCWGECPPTDDLFGKSALGSSKVLTSYGGGILFCGGSHLIDLVTYLLGRPTKVYSEILKLPGRDFDNRATAHLTTSNGVVHFEAIGGPLKHVGYLGDGWDERIEIMGTLGSLNILTPEWDQGNHKSSRLVHYDNMIDAAVEYRFAAVSPFVSAIAAYCRDIEDGLQRVQSPLTGYEVDEVIHTMYRSAETGLAQDIIWRL